MKPYRRLLPLGNLPADISVKPTETAVHREHRLRLSLANACLQRFQKLGVVRRQDEGPDEISLLLAGDQSLPSDGLTRT
jgi:hypothetical protein